MRGAHASLSWGYRYKRLKLAQLLGRLGVFLTSSGSEDVKAASGCGVGFGPRTSRVHCRCAAAGKSLRAAAAATPARSAARLAAVSRPRLGENSAVQDFRWY